MNITLNASFISHQCILADKLNKVLYRSEDLETFASITVPFVPSFITFHPSDAQYVMAYDSSAEKASS